MAQKKLQRNSTLPAKINDAVLGTLRFTAALDGIDEYQAQVKLGNRRVTLELYTDDSGCLAACITRARRIVERYSSIEKKINRYIEQKIYPSYNDTWRPDKKAFSLDQVLGKLKLAVVTTHPGPEATFWYTARDLFLGHVLLLRMGQRGTFVDHDMAG